jgi:hypothetical protein
VYWFLPATVSSAVPKRWRGQRERLAQPHSTRGDQADHGPAGGRRHRRGIRAMRVDERGHLLGRVDMRRQSMRRTGQQSGGRISQRGDTLTGALLSTFGNATRTSTSP